MAVVFLVWYLRVNATLDPGLELVLQLLQLKDLAHDVGSEVLHGDALAEDDDSPPGELGHDLPVPDVLVQGVVNGPLHFFVCLIVLKR